MEKSLELVRQLVSDFRQHENAYLAPSYQESQVRQDFIDKFFTALGWDVSHQRQKNPYEQEVKIENKVSTQGSQRRADYAFFVAPNFRDVKFYAEAKKPTKNLKDAAFYHQTIRYGWNSGTPIAILTDFEEFHILDCRYKPDLDDALNRKLEYFHYSEYADEEKFKKIFFLFGREAVAGGSLEKYVADLPKPSGKAKQRGLFPARRGFGGKGAYQPVDEAFLEELDSYRETLAKAFKKENPNLVSEELTEAVQRTIDRLVFIRFLEDKQIEDQQMINYRDKSSAWKKFSTHCRSLEPKYNGLVFKKHRILDDAGFVPPDDNTFADICDELADPSSPYDFDKIPISILGSIYERFLGKVVHATAKQVRVEPKPEVRKAGGVYYTPQYIVRYIVNETVGKLLYETLTPQSPLPHSGEGMSRSNITERDRGEGQQIFRLTLDDPAFPLTKVETQKGSEGGQRKFKLTPPEAAKLKIADIACGSGSFLIEVYSVLLDYHERYYAAHPEAAKKGDLSTRDGKQVLSLKKRQEILVNNIYGVDIDFQATEVTQLSLYLKLLEDATLNDAVQFSLLKEKLLPDLRNNIVCGNSLIGTDINTGELFDNKETQNLKPMNFEDVFPEIMTPSVPTKKVGTSRPSQEPVLSGAKEGDKEGVEKKASSGGGFDVVVGNPPYRMLQPHNTTTELLSYLKEHFFAADFKIDLFHLFMQKGLSILRVEGMLGYIVPTTVLNNVYVESLRTWVMDNACINSISVCPEHVFETADVHTSILVFTRESNAKERSSNMIRISTSPVNKFKGDTNIFSYTLQQRFSDLSGKVWNVLLNETNGQLIKRLTENYKKLEDITSLNRGLITGDRGKYFASTKKSKDYVPIIAGSDVERYYTKPPSEFVLFERPKTAGGCWDKQVHFAPHKLVIRQIGFTPTASMLTNSIAVTGNIFTIMAEDLKNELYILGIINSKLIKYYWGIMFADFKTSFPQVTIFSLSQLPIRTIDFTNEAEKAKHDHIVNLVEQMLKAKEELATARLDSDVQRLELRCATLDRQIDAAVYELYGLTEEEIKIVEGK